MRRTYGFTLIEVLITITVMVVLLILAVVSMSGSESRARDEERKTDANAIAQQLETYYSSGTDTTPVTGEYPSTVEIDTEAELVALLRAIDPKVLRAPGLNADAAENFAVATSNATAPPAPAPTIPTASGTALYVYQPLTGTGALCNSIALECRKFNLYYKIENNAAIQVIASKNQ